MDGHAAGPRCRVTDGLELLGEFVWGAIEIAADFWWGGEEKASEPQPRPYPETLYEERRPPPDIPRDLNR